MPTKLQKLLQQAKNSLINAYKAQHKEDNGYSIIYLYKEIGGEVEPQPDPVTLPTPEIQIDNEQNVITITNFSAYSGKASLQYTISGSEGINSEGTYTAPIPFPATPDTYIIEVTAKSLNTKLYNDSETAEDIFEVTETAIVLYEPVVKVEEGILAADGTSYEDIISVIISYAPRNSGLDSLYSIIYTLDGSEPDEHSETYTESILLEQGEHTLKTRVLHLTDELEYEFGPVATYHFSVIEPGSKPIMRSVEATFDFTDPEICASFGMTLPDSGKGFQLVNSGTSFAHPDYNISFTATKSQSNTNGVQLWHTANNGPYNLRMYLSSELQFSAPDYQVTAIKVNYTSGDNKTSDAILNGAGTATITDGEWYTLSTPATSFTIGTGEKRAFIDKITVRFLMNDDNPVGGNFSEASEFFAREAAAGRISEDGVTERSIEITGISHPVFVRANDAHLQDADGHSIRVALPEGHELNGNMAVASIKARVQKYPGEENIYQLIYESHEAHTESASPKAEETDLWNLMKQRAENMHKYVYMAYVYYDAADGTISYPFVPGQTEAPARTLENPSAVLHLSSDHNVSLPTASDYISISGVLDKVNGEYTLIPTRQDIATGIESITANESAQVHGNTITAPAGSRVYSISGMEVGFDNLAPGIYIVVMPEGSAIRMMVK